MNACIFNIKSLPEVRLFNGNKLMHFYLPFPLLS